LSESLEAAVDDRSEEMATRQLAVAAENWVDSPGIGNWQMTQESRVQLRAGSPAVKRILHVCCSTVIFGAIK
jgi:hypothetical protein